MIRSEAMSGAAFGVSALFLIVAGACGDERAADHPSSTDEPISTVVSYLTTPAGLPLLNSRPGAPAAIFLDFDGGVYVPLDATHDGYSEDSDFDTFNAVEQQEIVDAWKRVSAWFTMFNVNVSTDPDVTGDRVWVIISNDVESGGAGVYGSFPDNDGARARVSDEKAKTADGQGLTHEITHNLGGRHTTDYDQWGERTDDAYSSPRDPLHGSVFGQGGMIKKWVTWTGDNGVDSISDPIAKMLAELANYGPYAADDDVDSSRNTPIALTTSGVSRVGSGTIENPDDVDWFSFVAPATGNYSLVVARDVPSFVDLSIMLFGANGTTLIASEDGDPTQKPYRTTNDQFLSPLTLIGGATYKLRVRGHTNYSDFGRYNIRVDPLPGGINVGSTGNTPAQWRVRDIGLCLIPGHTHFAQGFFMMEGHGQRIENAAEDGFHYVFQPLEGDGSITARVGIMADTSEARAGVMIRESMEPDAPQMAVFATNGTRKIMTARATAGTTSTRSVLDDGNLALPRYYRVTRSGSTFTAAVADSANGPWATFPAQTITMGQRALVGLAVFKDYSYLSKVDHQVLISDVSFTGKVNPQVPIDATLGVPTLSTTSSSHNTVRLSWTAVSGAQYYEVEQSSDGLNYTSATRIVSAFTSFTVPNLRCGEKYYFRVRAVRLNLLSNPSNVASRDTLPGPVQDLTLSNVAGAGDTRLTATWTETVGETGYRVQRATSLGGPWTQVGSDIAPNLVIANDTGLTPNTQYFYRVITLPEPGGGIPSAISPVASRYTALPPLTGARFDWVTGTFMSFEWTPTPGATSYQIFRKYANATATFPPLPTYLTNDRRYQDTAVSPLVDYAYRICAANANTRSSACAQLVGATEAGPGQYLPPGWSHWNLGDAARSPGSAGKLPGSPGSPSPRFMLYGNGNTIDSDPEAALFAYTSATGDHWISARVYYLRGVDPWSTAGLLVRDGLNPGGKFVAVWASRDKGLYASYRRTEGAAPSSINSANIPVPVRLRITRSGSTFTVEYSTDGVAWTAISGIPSISMSNEVKVGLFTAAGTSPIDKMELAGFSDVATSFGGVYQ